MISTSVYVAGLLSLSLSSVDNQTAQHMGNSILKKLMEVMDAGWTWKGRWEGENSNTCCGSHNHTYGTFIATGERSLDAREGKLMNE